MITTDDIKKVLPDHLKTSATQSLADMLNQISADPDAARTIRETFLGHTVVLKEGKFKIEDYVNAAAYVSYRLMGYNKQESYARTFPARYQSMVARGSSSKDIAAHIAGFNGGKLVNLVMDQALIPVHVLNQDMFQAAIVEQHRIMTTGKSEMVRMQAANSLLTHLKPPERKQIELSIFTPETSGMAELKGMLTTLAAKQLEMIESGASTREIAHQKLVPTLGEMIDVTPIEGS